ncbi:MAG TPA: LLM class flavin-dependent oxidoreductase [Ktedonobacteraceae bacterium]|jgi:alkanesulfonate monooxygenase SsuD/methylene tetrahydromethanopterin reductase-like flavin-dependent oxidoreductase (luciferase family)
MNTPIGFGFSLPAQPNPGMTGSDYTASIQERIAILSDHIDSLWFIDHLQADNKPLMEGWTALTYWAALQPQLSIGHIVLCQSYRNPALLAKMAATLNYLKDGRFILGIGAGWKEDEYRAYNYDFPSAGTRLAELEETVQIIKALWTQKQTTFHGKHYQVVEAYCEPKPDPLPPIMIGGTGPRMLRLIARHADWWNVSWKGIEKYRELVAECERACDEVGRDPATLRRTWFGGCICAENEAELRKLNTDNITVERALVGTPQQIIEQMHSFIEQGVDHFEFVLPFEQPMSRSCVELLAGEVLPAFRH